MPRRYYRPTEPTDQHAQPAPLTAPERARLMHLRAVLQRPASTVGNALVTALVTKKTPVEVRLDGGEDKR